MSEDAVTFDEALVEFRDAVRSLARTEFLDSYRCRASQTEFPRQELKQLVAAGLTDLTLPTQQGGQGADLLALAVACEEIGYADPNLAYLLFSTNGAVQLLAEQDSEAIRQWAPLVARGHALACWAVTEPGAGSDAAAIRTKATRTEGGWRLTGEKTSVTLAPHADIAIVLAQTDPTAKSRGIASFLVDCNGPRVNSQSFDDPGFKPLGRGSLTMDDTFVADDCVLAAPGYGFAQVMAVFDLSRTLIGLTCAAAAQRALDMTARYVTERTSFGLPLAAHQGVSFPIAEHTTYVTAVRALAYQTIRLRIRGLPHATQAAMLKWWAPRVALAAINDSIVLHGQVGWSDEMPLQALMRDISGYQIGDGTPQIQKLIIARDVLGREAVQM